MYESACKCNKKKFITFMMIFAVLLCSFLGIEYDMTSSKVSLVQSAPDGSSLYQQASASMDEAAVHIIENRASVLDEYTSETVITRQLSSRRNSISTLRVLYLVSSILQILGLLFLILIYLYHSNVSCSQRYIISYIHNKDGQKA